MSDGGEREDQRPTRRIPARRRPTERMDSDMDSGMDEHLGSGDEPTRSAPTSASSTRRQPDPVRSKFLYGGAIGLAATVLVAVGLAALFDISFWAALGITALLGLGLVMLLAALVG